MGMEKWLGLGLGLGLARNEAWKLRLEYLAKIQNLKGTIYFRHFGDSKIQNYSN